MRVERQEQQPPSPGDPTRRLVADVRRRLAALGDPRVAAEIKRSNGQNVHCYGVQAAQVHQVGLELIRRVRSGGLELAVAVADPLFHSGCVEEGLVAVQVVASQGRHIGGGDFDRFAGWVESTTNRATADGLATLILSRAVAARPSLTNRLEQWSRVENSLVRRAAVMAFVPMVREGRFVTSALEILAPLMMDGHPDVQGAVGQVLMEASRLKPDQVTEFLLVWRDRSPRRLLGVATQKLPPAQRGEVLGGR